MEKNKLFEAVANVKISTTSLLVGGKGFLFKDFLFTEDKGFVRFTIQSTGGGVNVGHKLFVFDHRPATLQAAKTITHNTSGEDCHKAEKALAEAVRQPAKVVVMLKTDRDKTFHYINLYPTDDQKPTALLSETSYIGKHNADFSVKENNAFWSWESKSSSLTGCHWEMTLVTLTNEIRGVIVNSYGYANIGHTDKNLTVIGADIRQMSEEDLMVDLEP